MSRFAYCLASDAVAASGWSLLPFDRDPSPCGLSTNRVLLASTTKLHAGHPFGSLGFFFWHAPGTTVANGALSGLYSYFIASHVSQNQDGLLIVRQHSVGASRRTTQRMWWPTNLHKLQHFLGTPHLPAIPLSPSADTILVFSASTPVPMPLLTQWSDCQGRIDAAGLC